MVEPMETDPSNAHFELAATYVNQTSRHLFLTGKAGTGKTTFLRYIQAHTPKNTAVVAPTGVAAIHAGGMTIHAMFQLPFAPFIPMSGLGGRHPMLAHFKLHQKKRKLIEALDLLIIDEVSMVRSDVLDAIDTVLRHVRRKPFEPFGGVQMLYIGDLFQLPPVMPDDQWQLLSEHYDSPFFFDARVMQQAFPLCIELKKIYRQKDPVFIDLLNKIRHNTVNQYDLATLNKLYDATPRKQPEGQKAIVLSTHNYKADSINQLELDQLPGDAWYFEGNLEGDFSNSALPADKVLTLKEGAQVMFLKNDISEKRYYNGKLGKVEVIDDNEIIISFPGEDKEISLEREVWRNVRYSYNDDTGKIEEEEIGRFIQYPIRLAWAVTIHKSQGLTFHDVVIDAGKAFAPGQVYVALSRCTSMEGITLCSRIHASHIMTDERVLAFARKEVTVEQLENLLPAERLYFLQRRIVSYFDLDAMHERINGCLKHVPQKDPADRQTAERFLQRMLEAVMAYDEVATKFSRHLHAIIDEVVDTGDTAPLRERVTAAVTYFTTAIQQDVQHPLLEHQAAFEDQEYMAAYQKKLEQLASTVEHWLKKLTHAQEMVDEATLPAERA